MCSPDSCRRENCYTTKFCLVLFVDSLTTRCAFILITEWLQLLQVPIHFI